MKIKFSVRMLLNGLLGKRLVGMHCEPEPTGDIRIDVRPSPAQLVLSSRHEDGLLLLHVSTGRLFLCNRTGARVWQNFMNGSSLMEASEQLSQDYGVPVADMRKDALAFLGDLETHGLLNPSFLQV
jgi:hypothetical protein